MSIYYDWRFEEFSHLQMLLAFPYLIFKSRSAIRKVGLYRVYQKKGNRTSARYCV
jgi:hypothetical protein